MEVLQMAIPIVPPRERMLIISPLAIEISSGGGRQLSGGNKCNEGNPKRPTKENWVAPHCQRRALIRGRHAYKECQED